MIISRLRRLSVYPGYQRFFSCDKELRRPQADTSSAEDSSRSLLKTWPKPETTHEKSLAPRVLSVWLLLWFQINLGDTGLQVSSFFFSLDGIFRTSTGFVECYQPHPLPLFLPLSFEATESTQFTLCFLAQHGLSFASKKTVLPKIQKFTNQLWTNPSISLLT